MSTDRKSHSTLNEEPDLFISFDLQNFKRSFSYRDILTAACLALLFIAINELLLYYAGEESLENNYQEVAITFFILLLLANHSLYKLEHGRANNYIGRILQDALYIVFWWFIRLIQSLLEGNPWDIDIGVLAVASFFVGIFIAVFEIAVAVLKRLMVLFKWAIF
jgi:hypothetical protein